MDQSIAAFKNNLTKIRTGRANPAILDTIQVDYYGSTVPLSQVANVSLIDSRTISVQPWEKNMAAKIEKAIRESDLGLNPASMGDLKGQNFLDAGYHTNTAVAGVTQTNRNASWDVRSEQPNPQTKVGPFLNTTIESNPFKRGLDA
jgi:hypothetical protein